MTTVGKLLVFLNLVFSLVVGAFAVMSYSARTHMTDKYNKLATQYAVAAGNAEAFKTRAESLATQRQAYNDKIRDAAGDLLRLRRDDPEESARAADAAVTRLRLQQTEINDLKTQLAAANNLLDEERKKFRAADASRTIAGKDVEANAANYRRVQTELTAALKDKTDLVRAMNDLRDVKVATEIERDALKKKNIELVTRLGDLEKEYAAMKAENLLAGGARKVDRGAPPPDDLEGRITKVADRNLVKISIGTDNGLSMNNELFVFRLGTTPKFLGKIKIVSLSSNEAVGQTVGRSYGAMQEGDRVGAKILGGK